MLESLALLEEWEMGCDDEGDDELEGIMGMDESGKMGGMVEESELV